MRTYSELELLAFGAEIAEEITRSKKSGRFRVSLEGPLGAGKSTLARAILQGLGILRDAEGSPTFAIAHEYKTNDGLSVCHADGYRLKSDEELEATGLLETLWDPSIVVLFEWLELFPETLEALKRGDLPVIWIRLAFTEDATRRAIMVSRTGV